VTGGWWFLVAVAVAAVLFGLGFAAGGSLGEVALVWVVPLVLLALLALARRR
jgi:uncharacterized membrane protein YhaH (DUF805 family)